jgi:hypothetical protein
MLVKQELMLKMVTVVMEDKTLVVVEVELDMV